ncbi:hypothetical protein ACQP10_37905 (plasmid) [Streptosporangium sandarakinum]|uniref:hypothetical protein n=1 Tax=Streptosporangium sandarakinum TaxID=1260955 RepID=UPI003D9070EA
MFEVHGYFDNGQGADAVAYAVTVGEPRDDAADTVGVVSGSPGVVSLLRIRDGELVEAPHGQGGRLDVNDPATVLAALTQWTQVVRVAGEVPART